MQGSRGHATRAHTADVGIEAWGPSEAACYEEAVAAFVEVFADTAGAPPGEPVTVDLGPGSAEELLVLLLEEVLVAAEVRGLVTVGAHVEPGDHRLSVTLGVVPLDAIEVVGPAPKGVSYHGLRFGPAGSGWRCYATIDV